MNRKLYSFNNFLLKSRIWLIDWLKYTPDKEKKPNQTQTTCEGGESNLYHSRK